MSVYENYLQGPADVEFDPRFYRAAYRHVETDKADRLRYETVLAEVLPGLDYTRETPFEFVGGTRLVRIGYARTYTCDGELLWEQDLDMFGRMRGGRALDEIQTRWTIDEFGHRRPIDRHLPGNMREFVISEFNRPVRVPFVAVPVRPDAEELRKQLQAQQPPKFSEQELIKQIKDNYHAQKLSDM